MNTTLTNVYFEDLFDTWYAYNYRVLKILIFQAWKKISLCPQMNVLQNAYMLLYSVYNICFSTVCIVQYKYIGHYIVYIIVVCLSAPWPGEFESLCVRPLHSAWRVCVRTRKLLTCTVYQSYMLLGRSLVIYTVHYSILYCILVILSFTSK